MKSSFSFVRYFLNLTLHGDLVHIPDIFHALRGYCSELTLGLEHYSPYNKIKLLKEKKIYFF